MQPSAVRHLLLDADGVVQDTPGGWDAAIRPYLADRARDFLDRAWAAERPMLSGRGDVLPSLAATLVEFGVAAPADEVHAAVWQRIEPITRTLDLVRALRAAGYGVHLATNQERRRAAHMRTALGYDALFDVSCYSCDLGVTKPSPDFFHEAARRIGADPATILFVDDSERNVEGARAAGLFAEHWHVDQGHALLHATLRRHGIAVADPV